MRQYLTTLIAMVLGVTACTPSVSVTTATEGGTTATEVVTTTSQPAEPVIGQVRIGVDSPIVTLNPLSDELFGAGRLVGQMIWATVYDIVPDTWERVPDVVTSLPSQTPGAIEVAEDGSMTVRYEIAKGAMWSDGTPISGEDIAFTAEAMASLGGGDATAVMSTVIATDSVDRLAWITFSEASLAFEDALSVILPSHAIDGIVGLKLDDAMGWPSGGPFMLLAEQSASDLTLGRNPHYWKLDGEENQLPYLDTVTIISAEEPGGEVDLFASRSVDVIVPSPAQPVIERLESLAVEGAELQQVPTPIVEHLTFQFGVSRDAVNPESWNDTLDYRMAIAHSLDRQALLAETGVPWIPEIPGMLKPIGSSAWDAYPYSAARGADLVGGLGGEGEVVIRPGALLATTGNGDYRIAVGDALVGSFERIGVDLDTSYLDSLIFFGETIGHGDFDIGMWAWVSDGGYANQLSLMELFDPASDAADVNFGDWGSGDSGGAGPEIFSDLVAEARTTIDAQRFSEIVRMAENILADDLPLIPLFLRSSIAAVWPDSVTGVVHNGSLSEITWNVEIWQAPGGSP